MSYERGGKSDPGPIPPRWLECPRKSATLIGSKFLAFKTPLGNKFDKQIPRGYEFTPSMLFSSMKSYNAKIGLWIDLTNTNRFYNPTEVKEEGARYVKLTCKGHGSCPDETQVKAFVNICDTFTRKNPLEIIAVHCTHGFNRTGFMICSFMILMESWSCDKAVMEFAKARDPGIYKDDYIKELYTRYDDVVDAPPAPPLPDWCFGEDEQYDDDGNEMANGTREKGRVKRRLERQKKNPVFMEGVSGVMPVTEHHKLRGLQIKIQKMCQWNKNGFPGCQPISMTQENIQLLKRPYKVSWKADGTRYMMLIDGRHEVYFADRDFCIFHVPGVEFRQKYDLRSPLVDTLIDGEMVIDVDPKTGAKYPRYLIYDAVRIHTRVIINDNFQLRFDRILTDIIEPRNAAIKKGYINKSVEPFSIRRKDFWDANVAATSKLLSESFQHQLWHEPDGLILQPIHEGYTAGRCETVLKWKPASLNSVDFKLKIVTKNSEGCLPTKVAELYVGGSDLPFDSMKVTKQLKQYDSKIIECKLENGKWVFMRERTDKSFPNAYSTAVGVCTSILNPVTESFLLEILEGVEHSRIDSELMPPPPKIMRL